MWEWMIDQATMAVDPDRPMPPPGLDYKRWPFEICREVAREVHRGCAPNSSLSGVDPRSRGENGVRTSLPGNHAQGAVDRAGGHTM